MIFAKVDAQQKAALGAEMDIASDAKWYRRLKVIDLSSQGFSVPELSRMFEFGAGTIRRYIHAYNKAGRNGLQPGYGQGRPPTLSWTKAEWLDPLAQAPADLALSGNLTCEAATLVFLDSTGLYWCPDIGPAYGPLGQQLKVATPGLENPWLDLFGSLQFPAGQGHYTVHHRKRAADLLEHLQLLIDLDPYHF